MPQPVSSSSSSSAVGTRPPTSVAEIRRAWMDFFASKGCTRYASASLVPENDPTTLFTVAGMSQFKDMFLGRGTHPFTRAATVQKCIRTNDILNVGRTARHHTFFEMLGNFSFNDYFKRETIHWAYEFLTQVLRMDASRLSVSVHRIDDEAYRIWREEIGMPADRIFRLGDADNFWPANAPSEGPEGPGGCCSEIFWDHRTNDDPNDNLTSSTGRFVEIWNLVFPQFNVRKPHADGSPNLEDLGRTNIDTGSGLERVAAVMQGVYNNFDIDVFQTIIRQVCASSGATYDRNAPLGAKTPAAEANALIRRIADHVRAVTFCIADGALPGNSDRGYIVRRLIRRATLDLDKLGCARVALHEVVPAVVAAMGEAYPEIVHRQALAADTLQAEETLFRRTLGKGMELFQRALARHRAAGVFSGDDAFELVATHGFPKEVIAELAANEGLTFDEARFAARWAEHQKVSTSKTVEVFTVSALIDAKPRLGATPFVGYAALERETELLLLESDGREVAVAPCGTAVRFALRETPFYAESGGQVGDTGVVMGVDAATRELFSIRVTDTQKDEGLIIHRGTVLTGSAKPGKVTARVEASARRATTRHHSATHLLHSALCRVLGPQVEQQGSKVSPEELRFDFNHARALSPDERARIEADVTAAIAAGHATDIREMPIAEAKAAGAKAQFGEKYGAAVRVVTLGNAAVSRELCGGCHVANTADIGAFRIVKEEASSAGIRRITAVAGDAARALIADESRVFAAVAAAVGFAGTPDPRAVDDLARQFKVVPAGVPERVAALVAELSALATTLGETVQHQGADLPARVAHLYDEQKRLRKLAEAQQARAASAAIEALLGSAQPIGGIDVVASRREGDAKALLAIAEAARGRRGNLVLALASSHDGKVPVLIQVTPDLVTRGLSAVALLNAIVPLVGGRGGGQPELAQGSGKDASGIDAALAGVGPAVAAAALAR